MADSSDLRVLLCNCPPSEGPRIARALVEERLAACVNVVPGVRSFYRWQGKLYDDMESTLLIKTIAGKVAALTARVREIHPYELPEVIALPVQPGEGEAAYHAWVRESLGE